MNSIGTGEGSIPLDDARFFIYSLLVPLMKCVQSSICNTVGDFF